MHRYTVRIGYDPLYKEEITFMKYLRDIERFKEMVHTVSLAHSDYMNRRNDTDITVYLKNDRILPVLEASWKDITSHKGVFDIVEHKKLPFRVVI